MSFGKKTKSTQTTTPANPAVTSGYNSLLSQAQGLAGQPLQLYQGNLVAGLSPEQQAGISAIQGSQGIAQPYFDQAQTMAQAGSQAVTPQQWSPEQLAKYYSPYQNDVIDATRGLINQQNAEQQQSLAGNITAAGAWGGDRSAVLQSELARQQALAGNSTIANLENQGYANAQGEFNTESAQDLAAQEQNRQNQMYGAYTEAGLGTQAQNSALTGASALMGAGGLEQQIAQEKLNVPYEQYLQQQAYPYQSLDFLSSILGQAASGTGTTTSGSKTEPVSIFNRGGRTSLAYGGVPSDIPDVSVGFIPNMGDSGGGLRPQSPLDLNSGNRPSVLSDLTGKGGSGGGGGGGGSGSGGLADIAKTAAMFFGAANGGRVGLAAGGMANSPWGYQHMDDGGLPAGMNLEDVLFGATDAHAAAAATQPPQNPATRPLSMAETPSAWQGQATHTADTMPADGPVAAAMAGHGIDPDPTWDDGTPVRAPHKIDTGYEPSPWRAIGVGLLSALANHSLSRGALAGFEQYDKDNHPEVDHSGATTTVRYADGTMIDTGIPTEAAISSKANRNYRKDYLDVTQQTREAAIAQRKEASSDAIEQRRQAASDNAANRAAQLRIAGMSASDSAANRAAQLQIEQERAGRGRFGQPVAGNGIDPKTGKTVPGAYVTNLDTGDMVFHAGNELTSRTGATGATQALIERLQKDNPGMSTQQALSVIKDPGGQGAAMLNVSKDRLATEASRADPNFANDGAGTLATYRALYGVSQPNRAGGQAPPPRGAAPPPVGAPPGGGAGAPNAGGVPQRPQTVPPGAMWSPSRQQWKDPRGTLYNAAGQRV